MPWICEECGALEDGDMCRTCGNIAAVGQAEPSAHPESMYAKQGLRTGSSFKFHSLLVGSLMLVVTIVSSFTAPPEVPVWPAYAIPIFFLSPLWMPWIWTRLRRTQEAFYRWRFTDRF
ncbi:MAG TPA: hypothetical protein PKA27_07445 [Fimbriimonadaceae bacterium]|nr:hypothetical protein [Fimbriimonadaceae bacterium]